MYLKMLFQWKKKTRPDLRLFFFLALTRLFGLKEGIIFFNDSLLTQAVDLKQRGSEEVLMNMKCAVSSSPMWFEQAQELVWPQDADSTRLQQKQWLLSLKRRECT